MGFCRRGNGLRDSWCYECRAKARRDCYQRNRSPESPIRRMHRGPRRVLVGGVINKRCPECGMFKPLSEFYKCSSSIDRASSMCKVCSRAVGRRNYQKYGSRWAPTRETWKKDNPEWMRVFYAKRRSVSGVLDQDSKSVYEWASSRNTTRCPYCGEKTTDPTKRHVDHVVPLALGGDSSFENLVIACASCNQKKSAKDPVEFAREVLNG